MSDEPQDAEQAKRCPLSSSAIRLLFERCDTALATLGVAKEGLIRLADYETAALCRDSREALRDALTLARHHENRGVWIVSRTTEDSP